MILPVRDFGRFLDQSIPSILRQTERRLRLLVVDYGSVDDTVDIARRHALGDARIELICLPPSTLVEALNAGFARVTAPFVARQDADDISQPDRLARQLAEFNRRPEVVAVSGSCRHIDASGRATGTHYAPPDPDLADPWCLPSREPYLLQPFIMIRSDTLQALGGFRNGFHSFAEDTDLCWRLRRVGQLVNLSATLGWMRLHAGSITNASVVNGRILAINSQLAAISAQRIEAGREDIDLDPGQVPRLVAARAFEPMLEISSRGLDPTERRYLIAAASVKLLELANSRSFELETSDYTFVRGAYDEIPLAAFRGSSIANWAYRTMLARLLRRRLFDSARALMSARLLARLIAARAGFALRRR